MNFLFKEKKTFLLLALSVIILPLAFSDVQANRPSSPPQENVAELLNVGSDNQVKDGRLDLNALQVGNSDFFRITSDGNVVVGFGSNPPSDAKTLELEGNLAISHLLDGQSDFEEFLCVDEKGVINSCTDLPKPSDINVDPFTDQMMNVSKMSPHSFMVSENSQGSNYGGLTFDLYGGPFIDPNTTNSDVVLTYADPDVAGNICQINPYTASGVNRDTSKEFGFDYQNPNHLTATIGGPVWSNWFWNNDPSGAGTVETREICLRVWDNQNNLQAGSVGDPAVINVIADV